MKIKFGDDQANAETKRVMIMTVGGRQVSASTGTHWQVDRGVRIRTQTDKTRQQSARFCACCTTPGVAT